MVSNEMVGNITLISNNRCGNFRHQNGKHDPVVSNNDAEKIVHSQVNMHTNDLLAITRIGNSPIARLENKESGKSQEMSGLEQLNTQVGTMIC